MANVTPLVMEKYRIGIGWGAIILSALSFIPFLPLPALPPMMTATSLTTIPLIGPVLYSLYPMLLFAAGIGLVKGWDGGRKLFAIWSAFAVPSALVGIQYNYIFAAVDLTAIAVCLAILYWGEWRK